MTAPRLGVIGGSGLYALAGAGGEWRPAATPWGAPSDALLHARLGGCDVVFLPRHARGHRLAPAEVPYRANIAALKAAGCTHLLAVGACGSFRRKLPPGAFVVVDQYDDRTRGRAASFFGEGIAAHVGFARPVCASFSALVADALAALDLPHRLGGTHLVIEGPRFSTRAESERFRAEGADVIGMTAMPEAALAREAELHFANLAMVTDFDAWHPGTDAVEVGEIVRVLQANAAAARQVVAEVAAALARAAPPCDQRCDRALDGAIITAREAWPPATVDKLRAVAGRAL